MKTLLPALTTATSALMLLAITVSAFVALAGSAVYGIIGILFMELTRTGPVVAKGATLLEGWEGPVAVVLAMFGLVVGLGILVGRPEARWCMLGFSGALMVIGTVALILAILGSAPVAGPVWLAVPEAALGASWWVLFGSGTARSRFSAPGMSTRAAACAAAGCLAAIAVVYIETTVLWWSLAAVGLIPH